MKDPDAYMRDLERREAKEFKPKPQKKDLRQVQDSPSKKLKAYRKGK